MNSTPILKGKHAVVFGAGGSIGSAVAKEFATEGAEVFLSGRSKSSVEAVAKEIAANGGRAHVAAIDTFDDAAVNRYIDGIVKHAGKLDIVLDAAGPLAKEYGNGKIAVDLPIEEFIVPLTTMVRSRFITARAAVRHMIFWRPQPRAGGRRGAGCILPRAGSVEIPRHAGKPRGVADDHGQEPRARRPAAGAHGPHLRAGAWAAARKRVDSRPNCRRAVWTNRD